MKGGEFMWQGSLQNRLQERMVMPEPKVGMGATELMWSDREPYEVTEIISRCKIKVRRMDAIRIDNNGMSECQDYEYRSNPSMPEEILIHTKKGWHRVGDKTYFAIGYAEKYYDYSF